MRFFAFMAGLIVGVLATVGTWLFVHRDTVVYEARRTVRAGDIVIPQGTVLMHDMEMSEGFDRLVLYVNVDAPSLQQYFAKRIDDRGMLVVPYWFSGEGP